MLLQDYHYVGGTIQGGTTWPSGCCTGGAADGKKMIDGMILNDQETVVAYKMSGVNEPLLAENVIHHFTPTRLGQHRGETILAAAINTARDVDDILALEKSCVKDASSKRDVIKTASGELDPEMMRSMRYGSGQFGGYSTPFSLPGDSKAKNDYYSVRFGAESVVLQAGDEYTPYKSDRPGSAWQGFMDFLANTICISTNLPPSVVLPIAIGGTDIRRDLDLAQRVVEPWQADIVAELDEIMSYLTAGERADGELRDAPDDLTYVWHFPQKINVDRSQA